MSTHHRTDADAESRRWREPRVQFVPRNEQPSRKHVREEAAERGDDDDGGDGRGVKRKKVNRSAFPIHQIKSAFKEYREDALRYISQTERLYNEQVDRDNAIAHRMAEVLFRPSTPTFLVIRFEDMTRPTSYENRHNSRSDILQRWNRDIAGFLSPTDDELTYLSAYVPRNLTDKYVFEALLRKYHDDAYIKAIVHEPGPNTKMSRVIFYIRPEGLEKMRAEEKGEWISSII